VAPISESDDQTRSDSEIGTTTKATRVMAVKVLKG
jgi:hypothetical protein